MATRTLLHVTDLHVPPPGAVSTHAADPLADLDALLDAVVASGMAPEVVLVGGDLSDDGREPGAYDRLAPALEAAAGRLGARLAIACGNHDVRAPLRTAFGVRPGAGGAAAPDRVPPGATPDPAADAEATPLDHVVETDGLRVITLDTTAPGVVGGALREEQLAWLADELATPAQAATVLQLHHPPVRSATALDALRMRGSHRLADVLRGSDVGLVVCGHLHHAGAAALGGVPVALTPALSLRQDLLAPADALWERAGLHASRIDLVDGRLAWASLTVAAGAPRRVVRAQDMRDGVAAFEAGQG